MLVDTHIPGGLRASQLYGALLQRFSEVRVTNQGEAMLYAPVASPQGLDIEVIEWGETYTVCCPFCRERRFRLYIPHQLGQPHPYQPGRHLDRLGTCFNMNCLQSPENRRQLLDWLFGFCNPRDRSLDFCPLPEETKMDGEIREREPPGRLEPISRHPAAAYLAGRRFGPDVWRQYGLMVCAQADPAYEWAQDRIIAPVFYRSRLVGWQGRVPADDRDAKFKYYSCPGMPKRRLLYNYDAASGFPFVILCEGITDVWRVGPPAVALFGKTLATPQAWLIQQTWADKPVVVLLDGDAREAAQEVRAKILREGRNPVVVVELPPAVDPAALETTAVWNILLSQSRAAGLDLELFRP